MSFDLACTNCEETYDNSKYRTTCQSCNGFLRIRYDTPCVASKRVNHKLTGTAIPAINFLRNIVTQGIRLNELVGKEFLIGSVKVKAHDLCRPCKNLQESLQQKNTVKELLHTGGLRCEILSSGKICVDDQIIS